MAARTESELEWWLKWILAAVLVISLVLGALNFSRLRTYQSYFRESGPAVSMRYELLSHRMDGTAVRRHFEGLDLNCVAEGGSLGDRVCYAALGSADGVPALGIALFFKKGRLSHSLVQIPWWRHLRQKQQLQARLGPPRLQSQPGQEPLLGWQLPGGLLVYNRDRIGDLNPLAWSVVMWTARELVR